MRELAVCPQCKRHVRVSAASCPFCAIALSGLRARNVIPRSFTRAAIFSAALAGCGEHKKPPAPTAGSAIGSAAAPVAADAAPGPGSDVGSNAGSTAGSDALAPADAGSVADAGTADAGRGSAANSAQLKEERDALRKKIHEDRIRQMAKPYGAPPARRRIV
jgi:hypothetical protein